MAVRQILEPRDLPLRWFKKYMLASLTYRNSRLFQSDKVADDAAFMDVRSEYWSNAKAIQRQAKADQDER